MLSFFLVVLSIAAGSNASPCKASASSSTSSSLGVAQTGEPPGTKELAAPGTASTQLTTNPDQANIAQPIAGSGSGSRACPPDFINTVFNTNAPDQIGWPNTVWGSLTSNGINDWIGFSINTLDTKQTYDVNGAPAPTTPSLDSAQIHLAMDPTDVTAAVAMLQGASPPPYLGLFNEPDYSFDGVTPLTSPQDAASSLGAVFTTPHPNTKFLAPAVAFPNSNWLPSFNASCNGCFSQIDVIPMHIYDPDPANIISEIQQFHSTWPNWPIWITELSPARDDCTLTNAASGTGSMGEYINTLILQILALGYVERIFWNSGEWDSTPINAAPAACNPSLTDVNGNPTTVLQVLGQVCGNSTNTGSTATSKVKRGPKMGLY
ncbi:hypothetical protein JMJ35_008490 [Cladonia borealis]|uniref:Asl1-like glycosyl hydrolase catalytic domain-containing protein n=1 Tax=Cladonia borealis TaxID=184061 RepID=A0AA39QWB2_9LECA|nr:hypothetical protein JMJ35_008490 [Cladonia borealis]